MSSASPNHRRLRFGLVESATTARDGLAAGLTATLGQPCDLVPFGSYRALVDALREKQVDLAWLPPLAFLRAEDAGAAHLVTTMERGGSPTFGCAFLGRESVVESIRDLVGKRVAWTDPWSASGYVVPRTLCRLDGIDPDTAFSEVLFVAGTRGVLEHLRAGKADAGATHCALAPSGALMKHPWTDDDHVRVLAMGGPIPCDAICAGPGLDGAARATLRAALLKSPPELLAAFEASGMREPDARLYEVFRMAYSD